jgi:hypothetical protein
LFPASHVVWHLELDILLKEGIHLLFDWVWFSLRNESTGVVDCCHCSEVLVISSVAAHGSEFLVENVFAMASVGDSIVDDQLNENSLGVVAMETQVLTIARHDIAVLSEPFLHSSFAIRAVVLDETFSSSVFGMISSSLCNWLAPLERWNWLLFLEEIDRLLDSILAFLGSESDFGVTFEKHSLEFSEHLLEVWDKHLGILPHVVVDFEHVFVDLTHSGSW